VLFLLQLLNGLLKHLILVSLRDNDHTVAVARYDIAVVDLNAAAGDGRAEAAPEQSLVLTHRIQGICSWKSAYARSVNNI